jgi:polyisoprenoid-binding protein YceI
MLVEAMQTSEQHMGRRTETQRAWRAEPPGSEIRFSLRHLVLSEISGRVGRWRADIDVDYDDPTRSSVEVVVDAASFETGAVERDNHIRSLEFLDVRSFPEIHFRSTEVRAGDREDQFVIVGDLTIRHITRKLTVLAERQRAAAGAGETSSLVFSAHASVNRQDFGLRWNVDLDRGGVVVGDKVDLQIRIDARPAAGRPGGR